MTLRTPGGGREAFGAAWAGGALEAPLLVPPSARQAGTEGLLFRGARRGALPARPLPACCGRAAAARPGRAPLGDRGAVTDERQARLPPRPAPPQPSTGARGTMRAPEQLGTHVTPARGAARRSAGRGRRGGCVSPAQAEPPRPTASGRACRPTPGPPTDSRSLPLPCDPLGEACAASHPGAWAERDGDRPRFPPWAGWAGN